MRRGWNSIPEIMIHKLPDRDWRIPIIVEEFQVRLEYRSRHSHAVCRYRPEAMIEKDGDRFLGRRLLFCPCVSLGQKE